MSDTQPMAPTDAELTAIYKAANGEDTGKAQPLTTQRIFRAMRAAIAKWGAQPLVREPLTDEQVEALITTKHFREGYELKASDRTCLAWYRLGVRDGERAHGITGGQRGAE